MNKRRLLSILHVNIETLPSPRGADHPLMVLSSAISTGVPGKALLRGMRSKDLPTAVTDAVEAYVAGGMKR